MTSAIIREMEIRFGGNRPVFESIYFGGGTPSLLPEKMLNRIMESISRLGTVKPAAEITLEANPEDITPELLCIWKTAGINRLSIGLQSSHDHRLEWMNRSHNAADGSNAVKMAQDAGMENISTDLIFGYPGQDQNELEADLSHFLSLETPHISAYCLTIEPETVFGRRKKKGQLIPIPDEAAARLFLQVYDQLQAAGYQGYEISNFAKPGWEAFHNRNYWFQKAFTGIGPSAHGFDGRASRYANKASNQAYIRSMLDGQLCEEREEMTRASLVNEFILTRLRMKEGIPHALFEEKFGKKLPEIRINEIHDAQLRGWIGKDEDTLILTREGRLMADYVAMQLFFDDPEFE